MCVCVYMCVCVCVCRGGGVIVGFSMVASLYLVSVLYSVCVYMHSQGILVSSYMYTKIIVCVHDGVAEVALTRSSLIVS